MILKAPTTPPQVEQKIEQKVEQKAPEKPASLVFQRTNTEIRNDSLLKAPSLSSNEEKKEETPVNNPIAETIEESKDVEKKVETKLEMTDQDHDIEDLEHL